MLELHNNFSIQKLSKLKFVNIFKYIRNILEIEIDIKWIIRDFSYVNLKRILDMNI